MDNGQCCLGMGSIYTIWNGHEIRICYTISLHCRLWMEWFDSFRIDCLFFTRTFNLISMQSLFHIWKKKCHSYLFRYLLVRLNSNILKFNHKNNKFWALNTFQTTIRAKHSVWIGFKRQLYTVKLNWKRYECHTCRANKHLYSFHWASISSSITCVHCVLL